MGSIVSVQNKVDTGDGEEFQKVSQAAGKVESHSHRQFIGILAKPVKNGHGIIELLHFIDPRRIVLLQERCAELTKELLQAGLDEKCWAVSMEWYCSLRNVQPPGRRAIPVGAMVEYCPNSSKEQSRLDQFEKFCQEHCSDMHCLREKFGIEIFWLQTLRNWRIWTHQKSILKDQCRRSIDAREERFFFSKIQWQMVQQNCK